MNYEFVEFFHLNFILPFLFLFLFLILLLLLTNLFNFWLYFLNSLILKSFSFIIFSNSFFLLFISSNLILYFSFILLSILSSILSFLDQTRNRQIFQQDLHLHHNNITYNLLNLFLEIYPSPNSILQNNLSLDNSKARPPPPLYLP